jgi:hypothetical protein
VGSATLKTLSAEELAVHHRQFSQNREYYQKKWGGLPGHECLTTPAEARK